MLLVFPNDCQQWRIEDVGGGWYRIMAKAGNNVLDIVNGDPTPGADVRSWTWNGANPQFWKFETP